MLNSQVIKRSQLKLWVLANDKKTLYIGSKIQKIESRLFSWRTVYLPFEFDYVDAKLAWDHLEDLARVKVTFNATFCK